MRLPSAGAVLPCPPAPGHGHGRPPPPSPGSRRSRSQTIYLLRHGVAVHNLPDPRTGTYPDLTDPRLTDPPLVPWGRHQAEEAAGRIYRSASSGGGGGGPGGPVDLVVSSPLVRCLQTASLAFPRRAGAGGGGAGAGAAAGEEEDDEQEREGGDPPEPHLRTPPVLVHELVREAIGTHYPDRRRRRSEIAAMCPWAHLPEDMAEDDGDWTPGRREAAGDVQERSARFLRWLAHRPEGTVGIVSHGVWTELCLLRFCPGALDHGRRRVNNCDVFRARCVSTWEQRADAAGGPDGGMALVTVQLEDATLI